MLVIIFLVYLNSEYKNLGEGFLKVIIWVFVGLVVVNIVIELIILLKGLISVLCCCKRKQLNRI